MPSSNILALDVGEKRVGMALARAEVRVPVVLGTLDRLAEDFWQQLLAAVHEHQIEHIVIGLPRGLEGQETAQTTLTKAFKQELKRHTDVPTHWQDEALTSVKATEILKSSGKAYEKADVDGVAASLILEDYLEAERQAERLHS